MTPATMPGMMGLPQQPAAPSPMGAAMFGNLPYLQLSQPTLPQQAPQPMPQAAPQPQAQAPQGPTAGDPASVGLLPHNPFGMEEPPWGWNVYSNPVTGERYHKPMIPTAPGAPMLMPEAQWQSMYGK